MTPLSYCEPPVNPRDITAEHYNLLDEIDTVTDRVRDTGNTLEIWNDFKAELADLDAPASITVWLEKLGPMLDEWLALEYRENSEKLASLIEIEEDFGMPWK